MIEKAYGKEKELSRNFRQLFKVLGHPLVWYVLPLLSKRDYSQLEIAKILYKKLGREHKTTLHAYHVAVERLVKKLEDVNIAETMYDTISHPRGAARVKYVKLKSDPFEIIEEILNR